MEWATITRLSPHCDETAEGYRIYRDVPIARTGTQIYWENEVPPLQGDVGGRVHVERDAAEVFNPDSIRSFEGKPLVDDHPWEPVGPDNWDNLAVGYVVNPRRGQGVHDDLLLADLVFTTRRGIDAVKRGKRAISVGYNAAYEQTAPGLGRQRSIFCNHVALVDEGRCGARCSIMDGRTVYNYDAAWNEAEHPRGQPENAGQFAEGGGGGAAKTKTGRKSKGAAFVSPSLAEHLDFPQAIAGLKSNRQRILEQAAREIDQGLKLRSHNIAAVGAWSDGAENSIMSEIDGGTFEELSVAAAMKAHLAEQKDALVFQDDPNGDKFLYSFHAAGDLEEIHNNLLDDGIEFHTVVPTKDGATVYVADMSGDAKDAVAKGAQRYHSKVTVDQGQAKFIGPENQGGTDAEYRARSRAAYEGIIRSSGVRGADTLWQRIYNTYGATLHGVGDGWTADVDYGWREDIDWDDDWEEAKHPRGQPENKGEFAKGGGGGGSGGGKRESFGKSYVRAGETGEKTAAGVKAEGGKQAKEAVNKIAGKAFKTIKGALGAEDYEIVHEHFKAAKSKPKERAKIGGYLRQMAKAGKNLAKAHLKEEAHHAKHAVGALRALATGNKPTKQQAMGLFSYGARALMITGSMALGDPTGHSGALAATFAEDAVHHVLLEHAVKLFVGGGFGMIKGAVAKPERDADPGWRPDQSDDEPKDGDPPDGDESDDPEEMSDEDAALLQKFLECLADTVEDMTEEDAVRVLAQGETPDEDEDEGDDDDDDGEPQAKGGESDDETRDVDPWWTRDIDWDPAEHPREPEGAAASKGGEFTKGAGASAARMAEIRGKNNEAKASEREGKAKQREAKAAAAEAKAASFKEPTIPRSKEEPYAISTRLPSEPQQKKTGVDPHKTASLLVDYESTHHPEVQEWLQKTSDLLVGNTLYNRGLDKDKKKKPPLPYVGMPPGPADETPREATERFINFAKDNILSIYHAVPTEWRHRASLWYDGANAVAHKWAKDYDKTPQQIAGVIAAQSPKKDWFQNVEVAKRIIEYNSEKMRGTAFNDKAAERLDAFIAARKKPQDRLLYSALRDKLRNPDGSWMTLGELTDPIERAAFISMYDQANTDLHYKELSPEGKYGDFVRNKDVEPEEAEEGKKAKPGKMGDPTVLVWPVMENIAKGLRILDDGSVENISANLGDAHKVRNFFMNIMYPMSKGGHITADTHAIAGAFMRPLGQNDPEVLVGLGNASPSNNTHGLGGTYPIIAEAYRRAAAEVSKEGEEILARQMQSIVWEGLRGLFSPEAKRNKNLRQDVDNVWRKHMADPEKFTADMARKAIMRIANPETGAPRTPKWYARTA